MKDFIALWLLFVYQKRISEYDTFIVTSEGTPSYRTIDKKCIDVIKLFRHSGSIKIRWTESGNEWRREEILDGQVMDRTLHPSNQRLEQTLGCWRLFTSSSSFLLFFAPPGAHGVAICERPSVPSVIVRLEHSLLISLAQIFKLLSQLKAGRSLKYCV